jgi:hypothetical protein
MFGRCAVPLQLPVEDTIPSRDIENKTILLYGLRKIGKTTFGSQMDRALFIATEPGHSHLRVRKVDCGDWLTFLEICKLIRSGQHDRRAIVIDTIDNLFKQCREYVLKKNGLIHEQDAAYGKGYDLVNGAFHSALYALGLLPYGLLMISHLQEKEVKNRVGQKEIKMVSTLPNGAHKIVAGIADYILHADVEEIKDGDGMITGFRHVIHTSPTTLYEAGMRLEPGQTVPEVLPLNYNALKKALNGLPIVDSDWAVPTPSIQVITNNAASAVGEQKGK